MQNRHYELWFDMDEVLVAFSKYVINYYNLDMNDNFDYRKNNSYWWNDCKKVEQSYFENLLNQQGTFINPEPEENAIETITKLHNEGFEIHIITMPQYSNHCVVEKIQWIKKYLPFINVNTNVHFTGNKGVIAKPNRILLDDAYHNLFSWHYNNGVAIAFKDFGWNKDWKGMRVNCFDGFYDLVHRLEYEHNQNKTDISDGINLHNLRNYYINKLHNRGVD